MIPGSVLCTTIILNLEFPFKVVGSVLYVNVLIAKYPSDCDCVCGDDWPRIADMVTENY